MGRGGAEGVRTPDPRLAKPVLYQLSYRPVAPIMQGEMRLFGGRTREYRLRSGVLPGIQAAPIRRLEWPTSQT